MRRRVAGALALLNLLYGFFVLPESLPPERRSPFEWRKANPVAALRGLTQLQGIGPLVIVRHGRVAVGDAIASLLGGDSVAVLIGERPGLTAPDSMGAYLTWQPHPGTTDADRNCISNIRPDGIPYADAAFKLAHLLRAMRARRISGVQLKDDSDQAQVQATITNKT